MRISPLSAAATGLVTGALTLGPSLVAASPTTTVSSDGVAAVATRATGRISVRIGSFNIRKSDSRLPWTASRRDLVAAQIRDNRFDVIGLQEANGNNNFASLYPRVKSAFASTASCAKVRHTTIRDARARILYNPNRFTGSRAMSGRLNLDHSSRPDADLACWQLLTERPTGAKFLVVSAHLDSGSGRAHDNRRYQQAKNVIADVAAIKRRHNATWPVLWPGDFNSSASRRYSYDGPTIAMASVGSRDAYAVATKRTNGSYNSANQLSRTPIRTHHHVDHIFVSSGVSVSRFKVVVRLDGRTYRTPFASDHNPIRATVKIPY